MLQGADNLSGQATRRQPIFGNTGDNPLNGGAGADLLTGNAGDDTFVFNAGQANGDTVIDFDGQGAGAGDTLSFVGSVRPVTGRRSPRSVRPTNETIHSGLGGQDEIITLMNGALPDTSDWHFV